MLLSALKQALKNLLDPKSAVPAEQEVAVSTFTLMKTDAGLCRRLHMGEELSMRIDNRGTLVVTQCGRSVGGVPEAECPQMTNLLNQGARLSCRVVKLGTEGLVRVRVSIVV